MLLNKLKSGIQDPFIFSLLGLISKKQLNIKSLQLLAIKKKNSLDFEKSKISKIEAKLK